MTRNLDEPPEHAADDSGNDPGNDSADDSGNDPGNDSGDGSGASLPVMPGFREMALRRSADTQAARMAEDRGRSSAS